MSDSFLDKTKVVSVIYYSHNSSRYISPVCAVSGPLPVNITRHKTHRAVYVMLSTYLLLVPLKMFHKEEDDRVRSLDNKCIYMSDNDCRKSISAYLVVSGTRAGRVEVWVSLYSDVQVNVRADTQHTPLCQHTHTIHQHQCECVSCWAGLDNDWHIFW